MNKLVLYFRRTSRMRRYAITTTLLSALVLLPAVVVAQSHFEVLHTFNGSDGANPTSGLTLDASGNLYGTVSQGGDYKCFSHSIWPYGCGTIFELSSTGQEKMLYKFGRPPDGAGPFGPGFGANEGSLSLDSDGNLYGVTFAGGNTNGYCLDNTHGCGTVFKIDKTGQETVLYRFTGTGSDGDNPGGGVTLDGKGNLYGTTFQYGSLGYGTIFRIDIKTGKETTLYNFRGAQSEDGYGAVGNLVEDGAGTFYGVTTFGGIANRGMCGKPGCGTIFKVDKSGETVVYKFTGAEDGWYPDGSLALDADGNLYGVALFGGDSSACTNGCGTVYELSKTGDFKVLHSFNGTDGYSPVGPVVFDGAGNLYGVTDAGGPVNSGTVFKLTKASGWQETVLHHFGAGQGKGGVQPRAGLLIDTAGSLYGTAFSGGDQKCTSENGPGCGIVFKITQ